MELLHHSRGWPTEIMVSVRHRGLSERIAESLRNGLPAACPAPVFHNRFAFGEQALQDGRSNAKTDAGGRGFVQDELVLVGRSTDGRPCLLVHPDVAAEWPFYASELWTSQAGEVHLDGGDVLVLDGLILVGSTLRREANGLPSGLYNRTWAHLKSRYPFAAEALKKSHHAVGLAPAMRNGMVTLPFYHLDLFLTAIEDPDRVVFFLGHLVRDSRFTEHASAEDNTTITLLYRCLEGLVAPLESLAGVLGKPVEIRRLPIHLGRDFSTGVSFCNGVLGYENGRGRMTVMVPSLEESPDLYTAAEFARSRERAAYTLAQCGIALHGIESGRHGVSLLRGGLNCRTKVLRRTFCNAPA